MEEKENMENELFSPEEMLSPFDAIKETDAGSVTHEETEAKALGEYEKFWRIQDQAFLSDFDKFVEEIK